MLWRLVLTCFGLFAATTDSQAQVYDGSLMLPTQAAVDTFSYQEVTGRLTVTGDDISNLDGLHSLRVVGDRLVIEKNSVLISIDGLSSLDWVSGRLMVRENELLENIDGIASLTSIGGIAITDNPRLRNVDGLEGVAHLSNLTISRNDSLTHVNGLSSLVTVGEWFALEDNPSLSNIGGLMSLTTIGKSFQITNNPLLTDLDALSSLRSIGSLRVEDNDALLDIDGLAGVSIAPGGNGNVSISGNPSLSSLGGLAGLGNVSGALVVNGNDSLQSLEGLSNIEWVGDYLRIHENHSLTDLTGLESLERVGTSLDITANASLESMAGLSGLRAVSETVSIVGNPVLETLEGLSGPLSISGSLHLAGNDSLRNLDGLLLGAVDGVLLVEDNASLVNVDAFSSLPSFTGAIQIIGNPVLSDCSCGLVPILGEASAVTILNNASGCNSVEEVEAGSCTTDIGSEKPRSAMPSSLLSNHPNPVSSSTSITFEVGTAMMVRLSVVDVLGRTVVELVRETFRPGRHSVSWVSDVPDGLYFVRLETSKSVDALPVVVSSR